MSNLLKRRSRSESRQLQTLSVANMEDDGNANGHCTKPQTLQQQQQQPQQYQYHYQDAGRRKTSAELIMEAKNLLEEANNSSRRLDVGGLRLVSTRRPITPREPGRALYGKVSMAGRPPSSFSLRYLQTEGNRPSLTPTLEPIQTATKTIKKDAPPVTPPHERTSRRSNSLDSGFEFIEIDVQPAKVTAPPRKLPALEVRGSTIGSHGAMVVGADGIDKTKKSRSRRQPDEKTAQQDQHIHDPSRSVMNVLTSRKLLLTRNYDLLSQSGTEKLIDMLKEHAGLKDCTEETVSHVNSILAELYQRVRKNEKGFKRGFILGGLYGLVECSSPKILLAVARVVLALRVTGSNLTGACKLIFKVARNEQNDPLFHDNDLLELLIEGLGRASPLDDPEACIYGYGSIRFLTSSSSTDRPEVIEVKDVNRNWLECLDLPRKPSTAPAPGTTARSTGPNEEKFQKLSKQSTLVDRLAKHGAVELMVLHLQILNETGATQKLSGPPLHSLYQLSATLRALADVQQTSSAITNDDGPVRPDKKVHESIQLELACPHLIRAAEVSIGELEVQANIVRTLSVLSEDTACCHVLSNFTARIGMLLGPCGEVFNSSSEKLLALYSRLGYILGNIMAKYDEARIQFYHNDVAMEYLLNTLDLCSREPLSLHNSSGDTVIDVLIKMIRVVANMSVNSEVGFGLGNTRLLGTLLLNLLNAGVQVKSAKLKTELQELMHATLGALHNLCFYQDMLTAPPAQVIEAQGSLHSILSDLATALYMTLRTSSDEATQVETARVLGNLTRNEKARRFFSRAGGLPLVVQHLSTCKTMTLTQPGHANPHKLYDLKACAIGILVNMLGDADSRPTFINLKGPEILADILRSALAQFDWFLATIACQALWNLFIDMSMLAEEMHEQFLDEISDLLADHLDEERLYESGVDDATKSAALWDDFAVVATDLLERIQATSGDRQSETTISHSTLDTSDNDDDGDVDDYGVLQERNGNVRPNKRANDDNDDNEDDDDVYIEEM